MTCCPETELALTDEFKGSRFRSRARLQKPWDLLAPLASNKTAFVDFRSVKHLTKIGVFLLIGLLGGSPVFACMLPGTAATADEAACCREMASECGHGNMSSSHSCCKTLSVPEQASLAKGTFQLFQQLSPLYIVQASFDSAQGVQQVLHLVVGIGHSPPEAPPSSSAILRI